MALQGIIKLKYAPTSPREINGSWVSRMNSVSLTKMTLDSQENKIGPKRTSVSGWQSKGPRFFMISVRVTWAPFPMSFKPSQKSALSQPMQRGRPQAASTPQSGVSLPNLRTGDLNPLQLVQRDFF